MHAEAAIDSDQKWTEAIEFALAYMQNNPTGARPQLTNELKTRFNYSDEDAADILNQALQQIDTEDAETAPALTGAPAAPIQGGQPEKFKVDMGQEWDSEKDLIDAISHTHGVYGQDWSFSSPQWELNDDGTVDLLVKPKGGAPAAPAAPAPIASLDTEAVGPRIKEPGLEQAQDPALQEMARRRIDLQEKMNVINTNLANLRTQLEAGLVAQREQVQQEEPQLKELLKKLPDYTAVVDGWEVILSERKGYDRVKYKAVLEAVEAKAKIIAPVIAKLIAQLQGMKKYLTPVPPSSSVDIRREPVPQELKMNSSLKEGFIEGAFHAKADWNEVWGRFQNWVKSIFAPLAQELDAAFSDMRMQLEQVHE